jgi:hypothetical protein
MGMVADAVPEGRPRGVHTAIGVMAGVALERTVRALLQSLGFEKIVIEWKR